MPPSERSFLYRGICRRPAHLARHGDGSVVAWGSNVDSQCEFQRSRPGSATSRSRRALFIPLPSAGSRLEWGSNCTARNVPGLPVGHVRKCRPALLTAWETQRRFDHRVGPNSDGQCDVPTLWETSPTSRFMPQELQRCEAQRRSVVSWGSNHYRQCTVPATPGVTLH